MISPGVYSTPNSPEYQLGAVTEESSDGSALSHSAAGVSFLSDILDTGSDLRPYFLSPRACEGVLRRHRLKRSGRPLPPMLERALEETIARG